MKSHLQAAGMISIVFYGGRGYFLPNYEGLGEAAVDYIVTHSVNGFRRERTALTALFFVINLNAAKGRSDA